MTRSRAAQLGLAALAAASLGAAALAHHGWSTYTIDDFTLEGQVTELRFGNPHDRLTVVAADGAEWDVWLAPPGRNARANFDESKIAVGDTVIAYGNRHMDAGRNEMKTERITVRNGEGETTYDLYPERLES
jgi:VCBS repeat-containing protein